MVIYSGTRGFECFFACLSIFPLSVLGTNAPSHGDGLLLLISLLTALITLGSFSQLLSLCEIRCR